MSASPAESRRWVANLQAEADLAADAASRRRGVDRRSLESSFSLPPAVLRAVSALGTLLRAACAAEDRLWTPLPVAPARLAAVPGLAIPVLESGPLERLPAVAITEWWSGGTDLDTLLRVAHRRFALDLALELGAVLPGARQVSDVRELEAHLDAGGARTAAGERWVLKAPYSAAGRSRFRGAGPMLDAAARSRVEKLLELHGELCFEPWHERLGDYGACARVDGTRLEVLPPHGIAVDAGGGFRGIAIDPAGAAGLAPAERAELERCVDGAGARLRADGYRGPFNLDAWRYRDADGSVRFQPLGEINARWSFGRVAWALAERLAPGERCALVLGDGAGLAAARGATGARIVPLLLPSDEGDEAAWLATGP